MSRTALTAFPRQEGFPASVVMADHQLVRVDIGGGRFVGGEDGDFFGVVADEIGGVDFDA